MNLNHVAVVLLFVLILGAMLVDLIWHCAPRWGKWPHHAPQKNASSRLRRLQNVGLVTSARVRRAASLSNTE